ncbi:MAG: YitT family protein, partial [Oscillospiraceae bacterium]|nr:YitT family protein [Oscillospiraceae bacterium]
MKAKTRKSIIKLVIIIVSNIVYGAAVAIFIVPSGLITGGVTGISIVLSRMSGISASIYILGLNLIMFIVGIIFLGKEFASTTALSTVIYPIAMNLTEKALAGRHVTEDIVLCTVIGGILIGVSLGAVMRVGSSTGGLDI